MQKIRALFYAYRALIVLTMLLAAMLIFRIGILSEAPCSNWLSYPLCPKLRFGFLLWNAFLAWVPLFFLEYLLRRQQLKLVHWAILGLAILFFPNAPYLITDLIHIRQQEGIPIWYDALMLFAFAYLGLVLSMRALQQIHVLLQRSVYHQLTNYVLATILLLSGLGIYLGRVLRWNSWDMLARPHGPVMDTAALFLQPYHYREAWLMIVLFGTLLGCIYWVWRSDLQQKSPGS